jgi:hypothetical protein
MNKYLIFKHHYKSIYIYTHIPFVYQTGDTKKMGYFQPCKKFACLLIVLAMLDASFSHGGFKLSGPAAAGAEGSSFRVDNFEFK